MKALEKAVRLSQDRSVRARELKEEGKRVMGYICLYPPVELISAAGLVPYRITGSFESMGETDAYLERLMCPFVRSCFGLAKSGKLDFVDGMIWPHSCDNIQKTFDIWKHYIPHEFIHYLDVPHMIDPSSFEFFVEELETLKAALEEYAGVEITETKLAESIKAHNENRFLLRELSGLRKEDPPLFSGTEMMQVMLATTSLPVDEGNEMLRAIIDESKSRQDGPDSKVARILLYGSQVDDIALTKLLEQSGANVVIDDICMGTKSFLHDVAVEGDPLVNLAQRYLGQITCPRTFRSSIASREEELAQRFGYIKDLALEYRVNGAFLYVLMFCDCFEFDVPDVRDYLEGMGIPSLHIEDDYSLSGISGLKTRVEAFVEMIQQGSEDRQA